jgi:hypothetical protein
MAVQEFEAGMACAQFRPQLPYPEIMRVHVGVVEQHHGARREPVLPAGEILPHVVVEMPAIDVQQVDAARRHVRQRLVEAHAPQIRERAVARVVEAAQLGMHRLVVEAGMRVAFPRVDGGAAGVQVFAQHRFAERGIGHAVMRAELDQPPRAVIGDDPGGERHVAIPRARHPGARRWPEQRRQMRIGQGIEGGALHVAVVHAPPPAPACPAATCPSKARSCAACVS